MKYSSNSESESADEAETSEENNSSEAHNSDGDREDLCQEEPFQTDAQTSLTPTNECLQQSAGQIQRRFEDDGNDLQLFLRGDSNTQVPLRVEVFRLLQK